MPPEVVGPAVAAGMIELGNLTYFLVDSNEVWALVPIASRAAQGQVAQAGLAAMLAGDDVVDLKGQSVRRLGQLAVLAQALRTDPNTLFQLSSQRDEPSLSRHASALECLTGFGLHDRQDICCLDILVELVLLRGAQPGFASLRGQEVEPLVMKFVESELQQGLRRLWGNTPHIEIRQLIEDCGSGVLSFHSSGLGGHRFPAGSESGEASLTRTISKPGGQGQRQDARSGF
jgi:hypothetical protein